MLDAHTQPVHNLDRALGLQSGRSDKLVLPWTCLYDPELHQMAAANTTKGSRVFTSIDQLRPDTSGHNLTVKVLVELCTYAMQHFQREQ